MFFKNKTYFLVFGVQDLGRMLIRLDSYTEYGFNFIYWELSRKR